MTERTFDTKYSKITTPAFKVGDRVVKRPKTPYEAHEWYDYDYGVGVVASIRQMTDCIQYTVDREATAYSKAYPAAHRESELMLESECDAVHKSLNEEFDKVSAQITEKMKDAAELIDEAQELSRSVGVRRLAELYDEVQPLMSSMEGLGWNTSSLNC